jgi:hypothetical protein
MMAVDSAIAAVLYVVLLSAGFRCGLVLLHHRVHEGRRLPVPGRLACAAAIAGKSRGFVHPDMGSDGGLSGAV